MQFSNAILIKRNFKIIRCKNIVCHFLECHNILGINERYENVYSKNNSLCDSPPVYLLIPVPLNKGILRINK